MSGHAQLSPSSAHRWMTCPGSVVLSKDYPNESTEFAAEGTAAHEVAALALENNQDAIAYLERKIQVEQWTFVVDHEMAGYVQQYIDYVRSIGGELFVEQKLSIAEITGEEDAHGTSDSVIIADDELIIVDLKYGKGVKVQAENNQQLAIYALAALAEYELVYDFSKVRMVINQPRLHHVDEWVLTTEELRNRGAQVSDAAKEVHAATATVKDWYGKDNSKYLHPSEDACRFCPVRADCPSLRDHVLSTVSDDFVDVTKTIADQLNTDRTIDNDLLGNCLAAVPLIETWCKAIRAKAEAELFAGHDVPGFKLVEGRKGARAWADMKEAEEALKSMRLKTDEMYDLKLISPTSAEKLHKAGTIGPRQWPRLQKFITQPDGKPSVAPVSDKRPALVLTAVEDEFDDLEQKTCDLV